MLIGSPPPYNLSDRPDGTCCSEQRLRADSTESEVWWCEECGACHRARVTNAPQEPRRSLTSEEPRLAPTRRIQNLLALIELDGGVRCGRTGENILEAHRADHRALVEDDE